MRTIPSVLREAAQQWPDGEALVTAAGRLSFAELRDGALAVTRSLLAAGVQRGDRVAVWAPNTERWVVTALGALGAGAILVPVNTRFKGEEAHHVLATTRASLLVLDDDFLAGVVGGDPVQALKDAGELPELRTVVTTAGWDDFLRTNVPAEQAHSAWEAVQPADPCDLVFTSGTTGRPKGVVATHGASTRLFSTWADTVGLQAGDRMLVVAPFFHTFGYKAGLLACLLRGATAVPMPVFDVGAAMGLIASERITVVPGPPTLYSSLLEHPDRADSDLSSLRLAVTGASVVPTELIRRMRDELGFDAVLTAYGLTECTGYATGCRHGDPDEVVSLTSGRAVDGVEVAVVDAQGRQLPAGEPGEVVVRGYNVTPGYWEDPEATAAAFDADGWLHTGDVGVLDDGGNLRITDRLKDMYIVGGFNAYPAEIEQVLVRHEAVSEAAVIGVPDDRLGEVGQAYVVPRAGAAVAEADLVMWCKDRLAGYKVPRRVLVVDALPRNATGKVDKKVLRGSLTP
jgi:acyl-CoA synthetase (AMP-forming)/AMP-acid ligase II